MQLVTAAYGYLWGNGLVVSGWIGLIHLMVGTLLVSGGASAVNHYLERDVDAKMQRTQNRPIPAGKIAAARVNTIGWVLIGSGTAYLTLLTNPLCGFLAFMTAILYVAVYTPLKRTTALNTLIGAIPGALPPLGGWAAATGYLNVQAFCLFLIMFCWQMPHFFALAILYKADYKAGGLKMLPGEDESGNRTIRQIMIYAALLMLSIPLPFVLGLAGWTYLLFGMGLTIWFFVRCMQLTSDYSEPRARQVFLASIIYLPLILGVILVDFLIRII